MPVRVQLTGFEPFGGETINPSAEVTRFVSEYPPSGVEVSSAVLPVEFGPDVDQLFPLWDRLKPDVLLLMGQCGGAASLKLEQFAHNLMREGQRPESPILPGGPAAYLTPLPFAELAWNLCGAGIPAGVSRDAGTYVCNHLYYRALHRAETEALSTRVGFLHLPYLPIQTANRPGSPSMSLELMAEGVRFILNSLKAANA